MDSGGWPVRDRQQPDHSAQIFTLVVPARWHLQDFQKLISDSRESTLLYSERLSNGTLSAMTLHTADCLTSVRT